MSGGEAETETRYARAVADAVERALGEDLGPEGDLTAALVPPDVTAGFALRARRDGVLAGRDCATEAFIRVGGRALTLSWYAADGAEVKAGDTVLEVAGPLRPILTAERTALNFLGRLSGIATLTARFVAAARERNVAVAVLDTAEDDTRLAHARKGGRAGRRRDQSPDWPVRRRVGQGQPSRRNRDHRGRRAGPRPLAGPAGGDRMRCARPGGRGRAHAGADAVLLDNMDPQIVREAIGVARRDAPGPILTEVSGGVTLENIGAYAAAGPDRISVGALTHSAPALDLGLDLLWTKTGSANPTDRGAD